MHMYVYNRDSFQKMYTHYNNGGNFLYDYMDGMHWHKEAHSYNWQIASLM